MSSVSGVPVPVVEPTLQRLRMSYEEYLALPEKPKAEWVDGEVVVNPPASFDHMEESFELATVLKASLPRLRVVLEVGLWLPANRMRVPDVMVVERRPDGPTVTEVPVLVAEVLSPSSRSEDTVRKSAEYAGAGIGQFWIVDPEHRSIEAYAHNGTEKGGWDLLARVDEQRPHTEVEVGDHGTVPVDLDTILPADRSR